MRLLIVGGAGTKSGSSFRDITLAAISTFVGGGGGTPGAFDPLGVDGTAIQRMMPNITTPKQHFQIHPVLLFLLRR
jgi:hypothetical protein